MTSVLAVINGLGTGGAETSMALLAPRLADHGITMSFAVLNVRDTGAEATLRSQGWPIDVLAGTKLAQLSRLRRQLRSGRYQVLHSTLFEATLLSRVARTASAVPLLTSLVNTSYGREHRATVPSPWKLSGYQLVDAATGPLTQHFHAVSATVKRSAVRHLRISPERITVVPRGRPQDLLALHTPELRNAARSALGIAPSERLVLAVGRHEPQKGHLYLVEAAADLASSRPNVKVAIAGREGNDSSTLRKRVESLGLQDRFHFLGHRTDVGHLLVAADVFALPSVYEGLGGALLEAMAIGVPAVVSDLEVMREVTDGGSAALLVPPRRPDAIARGISWILDNPIAARGLVEAGQQIFRERYTLDQAVVGMAELYCQVANSS